MNGRYDFLILHLLSREEMYGFQVIKKVSDRCTDAEFELKTGMLYWRLRDICHHGLSR